MNADSPGRAAVIGRRSIPEHLPERLAITLWDFSWYTRAGSGEPFEDLGTACSEAVERGYNTIRICAAPLLLFGGLGLDQLAHDLEIEGLGVSPTGFRFGAGTRWYDVTGGYAIDLHARFFELLAAARDHGLSVILSSWEYQQSPAFAADSAWHAAIAAVPVSERYRRLAVAVDRMLTEIDAAGLDEVVAFIELHNEVDFSLVPPLEGAGEAELERLRARHPGRLFTASYGKPPHLAMHTAPIGLDVDQYHVYSYGVLDALQRRIDIRSEGSTGFPNEMLRSLLLPDAPTPAEYGRPAAWKLAATVVTDQMIYGYDWIDPELWDRWLLEHYGEHREVMRREIESRVVAVAAWSRHRDIPAVVGEGWIGYTPLRGGFEEGPVGLGLAEHGIRIGLEEGVWGVVLCSNAAPHHPMWTAVEWQRRMNREITGAAAPA